MDHEHADDGIAALLEHAFGSSDSSSNPEPVTVSTLGGQLLVEIQTNHGADDVTLALEISEDLSAWVTAPDASFTVSRSNNGDGTSTLRFRSNVPYAGAREFLRIEASEKP